jgi:hypothetical protein
MLTPSERSMLAKLASHTSWSKTSDRTTRTAPARAAFMTRFEREVDPDGVLNPQVRAVRAESAKRAYFARLAYRSALARRIRARR